MRNTTVSIYPRTLLCFLGAVALIWPRDVSATTIDPLLFEELVLGADFVGIVECEQAGGIVAEYRVVESWKGSKPGTRISIRVAVNYWEPQFPITLRGERFFVTAYKEAPSRIMSTTSGGGVPLWWRNLPADFRLPLFQGRTRLAADEEKSAAFEKTRKAALALLKLKPFEQEAALLKAVIEKDFLGDKWVGGEPDKAKKEEIRVRFAALTTAETLVDEILQMAKMDAKKWGVRGRIVFERAGGATALDRLEKLPADRLPWEKDEHDGLMKSIQRRHGMIKGEEEKEERPTDKEPAAAELPRLRKALAAGVEDDAFGEAFETLTRNEPGAVADYLINWKNPNKDWRDADRGYVLGSYFAWRCGKERQKHLKALLQARDPYVQVAGAVYLCFEDAETGMAVLKKQSSLEGDPGAWAALTLARRGKKEAVRRVLELFRALPEEQRITQSGMAGVPHRNLQKRVLVLLSNSARDDVRQPVLPHEEEKQFDYLLNWWKENSAKVVLGDPWLKLLEKQKVD